MSTDALSAFDVQQLDGDGLPSPMGAKARTYLLGTRLAEVRTETDAVVEALTDEVVVEVPIPLLAGQAQTSAGTWTKAVAASGVVTVARTASATDGVFWMEVPLPIALLRGGFKPTGVKARLTIGTAIIDDYALELHKKVAGSNSTALCGDSNADYNSAENTAVERQAVATHQPTVLVPTVEQAYLVTTEKLLVRFFVDADAGAAAVVTLTDVTVTGLTKVLDATPL
jgi:hypothetical protein